MPVARPKPACCTPRTIKPESRLAAAFRSVLANADNLPRMLGAVSAMAHDHATAEHMAMQRGKFWTTGAKLKVEFVSGSQALHDRILSHANAWSQYANLDFVGVPQGQGTIRVGFEGTGYWSLVGTDALSVSPGEFTLNLQGFDDEQNPPEEGEWHRVVRHEFGHAIGALHEQQRPEEVARLDPQAVIAYFGAPPNSWSPQEVEDQILTPFNVADVVETPDADELSIMMYFFEAELTKNHKPIVGGSDLTDRDKLLASQVYPGRWSPTTTPPPPVVPPIVIGPNPSDPDGLGQLWQDNMHMLDLVNRARAARGRNPLTWNKPLTAAAWGWSKTLAANGKQTHFDGGSTPWTRIAACGFPLPSPSYASECLGFGSQGITDANILGAWLNDPPHRQIILGQWTDFGLGKVVGPKGNIVWTADFGRLTGS